MVGLGISFIRGDGSSINPVPVNSGAPVLTGSGEVGEEITTSNGTWSNTPLSYTYQWRLDGINIPGETTNAYTPVEDDIDKFVSCVVTAHNVGGPSDPKASNSVEVIPAPVGYETAAVRFDGATLLRNAALAATDNGVGAFSLWFLAPDFANVDVYWVCDPDGAYINSFVSDVSATMGNAAATVYVGDAPPAPSTGAWHNVIFAASIEGDPVAKTYIDGIDVTGSLTETGTGPADMSWDGLSFLIAGDATDNCSMFDLADVWIAPGQDLLVAGDIPAPTLAKFISGGKPVDLGADGSEPTGTAPAIFLRRAPAAAAATFATNLGTGGNFSIEGTLTAAPTSPSD
jgi:hypothetical protein